MTSPRFMEHGFRAAAPVSGGDGCPWLSLHRGCIVLPGMTPLRQMCALAAPVTEAGVFFTVALIDS